MAKQIRDEKHFTVGLQMGYKQRQLDVEFIFIYRVFISHIW